MRIPLKHSLIVAILCVPLFMTMGLDFGSETSAVPADAVSEPASAPVVRTIAATPRPEPAQAAEDRDSTAKEETELQTGQAVQNAPLKYEVTAYYLNVREEANNTSTIVDVVPKGTELEVVKPTGNGWLELHGGGYVHGKYAKAIEGQEIAKKPGAVVILSADSPSAPEAEPEPEPLRSAAAEPSRPEEPTNLVQSESGLTEDLIAALFEGTALEGEGLEQAVLEVEENYGINSYFTIAVMKLESGHGKSRIAKLKNNLFGLNATGNDPFKKAFSFESKSDSVTKFGQIIADYYLDKGLTSIEKVAKKYCLANPKWPKLVQSIMKSDYKKIS